MRAGGFFFGGLFSSSLLYLPLGSFCIIPVYTCLPFWEFFVIITYFMHFTYQ